MKKIPTLFKREFEGHNIVNILPEVTEGMEWVLKGEGTATVKIDGSCCAIINGEFYKRYDAKKGKPVPDGAIKCQEDPDPVTGHLPCWVKVSFNNPADKWFVNAYNNTPLSWYDGYIKTGGIEPNIDGTYEAIGPHFQGNPYDLADDILERHGERVITVERTFEGIKKYLEENYIEGIVFWKDGEPKCKIKRSDFGFKWG
jgi:hypothetical protein